MTMVGIKGKRNGVASSVSVAQTHLDVTLHQCSCLLLCLVQKEKVSEVGDVGLALEFRDTGRNHEHEKRDKDIGVTPQDAKCFDTQRHKLLVLF